MSGISEDLKSACSTPYVSAPSSPGRGSSSATGYFFSAPASPMHYVLSTAPSTALSLPATDTSSIEFEFSSRFSSESSITLGSMSTADELFSNGQIRTKKLSSHLQRPQILAPLLDLDGEDEDKENERDTTSKRGRDLKFLSRSMGRKARSLSPLRKPEINCEQMDQKQRVLETKEDRRVLKETLPLSSASSSRSSSSGRNSKKWIYLKDLLYRSKSEGRGNGKEKFWTSLSFSPSKERKLSSRSLNISRDENMPVTCNPTEKTQKHNQKPKNENSSKISLKSKPSNGVAKRRTPPSAHELHYTANRAQAEEMKKRTYLPYKQGVFGCLGITSKGYHALNGFARTLNPVSSR